MWIKKYFVNTKLSFDIWLDKCLFKFKIKYKKYFFQFQHFIINFKLCKTWKKRSSLLKWICENLSPTNCRKMIYVLESNRQMNNNNIFGEKLKNVANWVTAKIEKKNWKISVKERKWSGDCRKKIGRRKSYVKVYTNE